MTSNLETYEPKRKTIILMYESCVSIETSTKNGQVLHVHGILGRPTIGSIRSMAEDRGFNQDIQRRFSHQDW